MAATLVEVVPAEVEAVVFFFVLPVERPMGSWMCRGEEGEECRWWWPKNSAVIHLAVLNDELRKE